MKNLIVVFISIFLCVNSFAQTNMKIRKTDNSIISIPISEIDSIYYEESSSLPNCGTVSDYDGNVYQSITIGNQCWMAENLRTTHYSDGNIISDYLWPENDSTSNAAIFGALYSWNAIMNGEASSDNNPSGVQGVCPDGWHVPSDSEIKELEMYLGMTQSQADNTGWRGSDQASKLSYDNSIWQSGALVDNASFEETGFNALPSGYNNGSFHGETGYFFFWCTTQYNSTDAIRRQFTYNMASIYRAYSPKTDKYSVRCIKD
jgi:uncharacterized protein (TIGR02145 family)